MIPNYINQDIWEHMSIQVGNDNIVIGGDRPNITADIEWGLSKSEFGYSIMERDDTTGDYEVTFYFLDEETKEVVKYENKSLPIPKGPRVSDDTDNDDETTPPAVPTEGDPTEAPNSSDTPYNSFGLSLVIALLLASISSFGFGPC